MNQCEATKAWYTKGGVIAPIISMRNQPNPFGITHKYGKKAGQLKKNKLITEQEFQNAQTQVSDGQRQD